MNSLEKWQSHFSSRSCHLELTDLPELLKNCGESLDQVLLLCASKIQGIKSEQKTYKPIRRAITSSASPSKSPIGGKENPDDLDLTGSPLKCSFDLGHNDDLDDSLVSARTSLGSSRARYEPLRAREARSLVSSFVAKCTNEKFRDVPLPLFALCDGTENGTVYLGAHFKSQIKSLTLHEVKVKGPFKVRDLSPSLKQIKSKHGNNLDWFEAHSIYNMTSSGCSLDESNMNEDLGNELSSELKIHQKWKNPHQLLEEASPDAQVNLEAKIVPGDEKIPTFQLFRELKCLFHFINGLEDQGIVWKELEENETRMEEDLMKLLESLREEGNVSNNRKKRNKRTGNLGDHETSEDFGNLFSSSRLDLDFQDHLWVALHKAQSYEELCLALTHTFTKIKQEELRPFMFSNQSSRIDKLITSIVRGDSEIPEMSGSLPLQLLVEIGIEKLRRDYIHLFMSSFLAGKEELGCFLRPDEKFSDSFRNLNSLHLVADLVNLIQTFLAPGHDCLRKIVSQALQKLRSQQVDLDYNLMQKRVDFNFDILPAHVKDRLAKINPTVWQCMMKSNSSNGIKIETVAHLTTEPPLDCIKSGEEDEEIDKHSMNYFYTEKFSIERQLNK